MRGERAGRSLTSSFKLPIWVLYYRDPITFCASIIESLEENCLLLILSVTEKSKKIFPVTYKYQRAFQQKFTLLG